MKKIEIYNSGMEIPVVYRDDNIALLDDLSVVKDISDAVLLEGHLLVLILRGHAQIKMYDKVFDFSPHDLFLCSPRSIINNIMMSMDLEVRAIFVTSTFVEQMIQMTNLDFSVHMLGLQSEVIHLTDKEIEIVLQYFVMLSHKYKAPETPFKSSSVSALMSSMIYTFSDILSSHDISVQDNNYTSANQIFRQFINLLKSPQYNMRMVKDYAVKLNISPKYFSSICHSITGKSASALINEAIVNDAKQLLHTPGITVKQTAIRLGFANASHFGTFFRRHVGISPQQYRKGG